MNRVVEKVMLPNHVGQGPHQSFLGWLLVALQTTIAELARRVNQSAPKDGSELQRMVSLESVTLNISADVDDADPGYYSVVKCVLTGSGWSMTGLANGAGQEGVGGRIIKLVNASASALDLTLTHEDTDSLVGNRFLLPRGLGITVAQYMTVELWYDLAALRWRVV